MIGWWFSFRLLPVKLIQTWNHHRVTLRIGGHVEFAETWSLKFLLPKGSTTNDVQRCTKWLKEGKIQNRKWQLHHLATSVWLQKDNKLQKVVLLQHAQARYPRKISEETSWKAKVSNAGGVLQAEVWSVWFQATTFLNDTFHPWKVSSVFFVGGETWVDSRLSSHMKSIPIHIKSIESSKVKNTSSLQLFGGCHFFY